MSMYKKIKDLATFYENNGLNREKNNTYIVLGDNYSVKDLLKEKGAKYNKILGWHFPTKVEVPNTVSLQEIHLDDLISKDADGAYRFTDLAAQIVEKITTQYRSSQSTSDYVGEVGQRLRDVPATIKNISGFMGGYGWTNIITFDYEGNDLIWFTGTAQYLTKGDKVSLTGTIKSHKTYRGVKQTMLNRCIIKEV